MSKSKNPFGDDDDDDYEGNFGQPSKTVSTSGGFRNNNVGGCYGSNQYGSGSGRYDESGMYGGPTRGSMGNTGDFGASNSIQSQMEMSKQRTEESSIRALQSIYRSEQIGVETAAELVDQGEKLTKVEQKVDEIEQMQKQSQQHINSLSSVFGGIKNFFSKKSKPANIVEEPAPIQIRNPNLHEAMNKSSNYQPNTDRSYGGGITTGSKSAVDTNLDHMSDGMSRLKGLATGLNNEIEAQNQQLDRLAPKIDRTTATTKRQNQQMNTILYGKPK